MKFQILDIALVLSITCLASAAAFAPQSLAYRKSTGAFVSKQTIQTTTSSSSSSSKLFSQWDEEEEDTSNVKRASFEEATKAATDEDDAKELAEMGDFDATSTYNVDDVSRYRDAIKKRAASIGLEKRSAEEIAADQAAALQKAVEKGEGLVGAAARSSPDQLSDMLDESQVQRLDLSKISSEAPRGPDEDLPAMMYDPTDDMTQEEMEEADPIGFKPWNEQVAWVIDKAEFPTPLSVLGETIVTIITVVVTAVIFTQWDELCRQAAFNFDFVPRPEEVAKSLEGMLMPGDTVLGMGAESMSGQEMLKMLQDGTKETIKAVQDGTIKDILAGDVPAEL
mmetsp:Transcript_16543/g.45585  ORF Transcript_16543/g.45585 Transcript_16543/m.45585 type:complete len:338 (+) Transcript_16543:272-1285(+)